MLKCCWARYWTPSSPRRLCQLEKVLNIGVLSVCEWWKQNFKEFWVVIKTRKVPYKHRPFRSFESAPNSLITVPYTCLMVFRQDSSIILMRNNNILRKYGLLQFVYYFKKPIHPTSTSAAAIVAVNENASVVFPLDDPLSIVVRPVSGGLDMQ